MSTSIFFSFSSNIFDYLLYCLILNPFLFYRLHTVLHFRSTPELVCTFNLKTAKQKTAKCKMHFQGALQWRFTSADSKLCEQTVNALARFQLLLFLGYTQPTSAWSATPKGAVHWTVSPVLSLRPKTFTDDG